MNNDFTDSGDLPLLAHIRDHRNGTALRIYGDAELGARYLQILAGKSTGGSIRLETRELLRNHPIARHLALIIKRQGLHDYLIGLRQGLSDLPAIREASIEDLLDVALELSEEP